MSFPLHVSRPCLLRCTSRRQSIAHHRLFSQTIIEKIVQKYAVGLPEGSQVRSGDYVMLRPEHIMTHDNTGPVISKFKSIGAKKIFNPQQPVFTLDHDVQNKSDKNLAKYASIEAFAREHDIDFYPAGRGIGHQIMVEEGYAFPYTLTVASDSHSNMYGGVGCVGTPIVRTDAAALWTTGKTWWQIPRMVKVELSGALRPGVTGKDIIVALCGLFNNDEVLNSAIEFTGDGLKALSVDDRLTISNMTTEWGALVGYFPVDNTLLGWYDSILQKQNSLPWSADLPPHPRINQTRLDAIRANPLSSDKDASYSSHLELDLSTLVPHISGPNSVKISTALPTLEDSHIPIQKAFLVSCTNSRLSDIAAAARVFKQSTIPAKVHPDVSLYVSAASSVIQTEAEQNGDWDTLLVAGAKVLPPGCGPCIGLGVGLLEEGETGISASNRNYKGRMGSPKAQAYLGSPEIVAASAIQGYITGPDSLSSSPKTPSPSPSQPKFLVHSSPSSSTKPSENKTPLLPGFPSIFSGPLIFAPQDNLNTDGIYPGKYTYQDDITLERQAQVVMENYDPDFAALVQSILPTSPSPSSSSSNTRMGVILISGFNFGTGSSREQAATALKSAGIPLVIAGSFGDIFKRNAINNGLICLECPSLVEDFTQQYGKDGVRGKGGNQDGELTVEVGVDGNIEMDEGKIVLRNADGTKSYDVRSVGASVQELWLEGGLEGFILKELKESATS